MKNDSLFFEEKLSQFVIGVFNKIVMQYHKRCFATL